MTPWIIRLNIIFLWLCLLMIPLCSHAQAVQPSNDDLGQTIQIYTRFHAFVGKPSWLLMIRDVDHNQNIPYLFDVRRGNNTWVAFTGGRNYLITISNLKFSPYRRGPYRQKKINNFCQLESNGHIIRGKSLYITINGDLSPNTNSFTCHVSQYADPGFPIAPQPDD